MNVVIWIIVALICGLFASLLVDREQKPLAFALGAMFGPLGVLVAAIIGRRGR